MCLLGLWIAALLKLKDTLTVAPLTAESDLWQVYLNLRTLPLYSALLWKHAFPSTETVAGYKKCLWPGYKYVCYYSTFDSRKVISRNMHHKEHFDFF